MMASRARGSLAFGAAGMRSANSSSGIVPSSLC
jgi:hypothetical protein